MKKAGGVESFDRKIRIVYCHSKREMHFMWYDFNLEEGQLDGVTWRLARPRERPPQVVDAEGRPMWYWRAHFWNAFPFVEVALLRRGWHVAFIEVDELYGGPECMRRYESLYDEMVRHGFSRRPAMVGMSRGGLDVVNWAILHPDRLSCIYLDNPVLNVFSWPLGRGASRDPDCASGVCWENFKRAWHLSEQEALAFGNNPIDAAIEPLAKANIPLFIAQAGADTIVPKEENADLFVERLRKAGCQPIVFRKPECDHHPHSLNPPDPIVDFIEDACRNT